MPTLWGLLVGGLADEVGEGERFNTYPSRTEERVTKDLGSVKGKE